MGNYDNSEIVENERFCRQRDCEKWNEEVERQLSEQESAFDVAYEMNIFSKKCSKCCQYRVGQIIDGKKIADDILEKIRLEKEKYKDEVVKLLVVTIGDDPASKVYVNNKKKACEKVGFVFENLRFTENDNFDNIKEKIVDCTSNKNNGYYGMIVQLPIVSNVLTEEEKQIIQNYIPNKLDVDGFGQKSMLKVYNSGNKDFENACYPCTPMGIIDLLNNVPTLNYSGKTALVIGRSNIVGKPIANMLLAKNMTVITAHSRTPKKTLVNLANMSDVIVSAVGKKDILTEEDLKYKEGRIIIDVGMNRDENGKFCGDISERTKKITSDYYTSTPGGTGPMTVAELIKNTYKKWKENKYG